MTIQFRLFVIQRLRLPREGSRRENTAPLPTGLLSPERIDTYPPSPKHWSELQLQGWYPLIAAIWSRTVRWTLGAIPGLPFQQETYLFLTWFSPPSSSERCGEYMRTFRNTYRSPHIMSQEGDLCGILTCKLYPFGIVETDYRMIWSTKQISVLYVFNGK